MRNSFNIFTPLFLSQPFNSICILFTYFTHVKFYTTTCTFCKYMEQFTEYYGDAEFAGVENAGVDLSPPDCRAEKCGSGNIGKSNVWNWKAKLVQQCCVIDSADAEKYRDVLPEQSLQAELILANGLETLIKGKIQTTHKFVGCLYFSFYKSFQTLQRRRHSITQLDIVDYQVIKKDRGYVYELANQSVGLSPLKLKEKRTRPSYNALRSAVMVQRNSSAISSVWGQYFTINK